MKPTKRDKLDNAYAAYLAQKEGRCPRPKAKDGSIPTRLIVPCPDLPEAEVLKQCLKWLKARRIVCWRHDCGKGPEHVQFGIKGAGDIIGILPNGQYFEVETKKGTGGRLSSKQQQHKKEVESSNGVYLIIHGVSELEYYMRELI